MTDEVIIILHEPCIIKGREPAPSSPPRYYAKPYKFIVNSNSYQGKVVKNIKLYKLAVESAKIDFEAYKSHKNHSSTFSENRCFYISLHGNLPLKRAKQPIADNLPLLYRGYTPPQAFPCHLHTLSANFTYIYGDSTEMIGRGAEGRLAHLQNRGKPCLQFFPILQRLERIIQSTPPSAESLRRRSRRQCR